MYTTQAAVNFKAWKKKSGLNGIRTHDLCDTGAKWLYNVSSKCKTLGYIFFSYDPDLDLWFEITRIIAHQRNRWIPVQGGFIGFFDAPWSVWSLITNPNPDHTKKMRPKFQIRIGKTGCRETIGFMHHMRGNVIVMIIWMVKWFSNW